MEIKVSSLKNGESTANKWHSRIPKLMSISHISSSGNVREFTCYYDESVNNFTFTSQEGESVTFPNVVNSTTAEYVTYASDNYGGFIASWIDAGIGYINFLNDLVGRRETISIGAVDSITCGLFGSNNTISQPSVLVCSYVKNNIVIYRNATSRYSEPIEIAELQNNVAIRVIGDSLDNRFLIRFFSKIKLV